MPPANFLSAKFKGRIDCLVLGDAWPTLGKGYCYSLINLGYETPTDKRAGGRRIGRDLISCWCFSFIVVNGEFVRKKRSTPTPKGLREKTLSVPIPLHFISKGNMA